MPSFDLMRESARVAVRRNRQRKRTRARDASALVCSIVVPRGRIAHRFRV
jgi:hypothetical protein